MPEVMLSALPGTGLQIRSTVGEDETLVIELADVTIARPDDDQAVVRIEAAPINPADLIPLLAGADPASAQFEGTPERPRVIAQLSPEAVKAFAGRVGRSLAVGLEGAGCVVAVGKNAQALLGQRVAVLSLSAGLFGQYCTVPAAECMPLPEGVTARNGAGLFCNPLTALAIVETLRQTGQKALVHTAATSNLGQMLVRICKEDAIPLVNIVRRQEQVDLLRSMGAEHVCNSSAPSFREDLLSALRSTGAMVAFDAIGGGIMACDLLSAMEAAATKRSAEYSPYGSSEPKRVYIYGRLDPSPTLVPKRNYGMVWGIDGWAMPPILERAGPARAKDLTQRIVDNLTTTFAGHYGHEISLAQALQRDVMLGYCRQATGQKYLINPLL
ncbi:MAG: alcohol dehydrogenase catalytic domain-containing protein [Rhizomicrobium sp.]